MQKALNTKTLSNKTKIQTNVGIFIFIKLQQPINLASSSSKQIETSAKPHIDCEIINITH